MKDHSFAPFLLLSYYTTIFHRTGNALNFPDQNFFSGKMQKDLIQLMHNPTIKYVSGGHLSTVLKVEDYVQTIRGFLLKNF